MTVEVFKWQFDTNRFQALLGVRTMCTPIERVLRVLHIPFIFRSKTVLVYRDIRIYIDNSIGWFFREFLRSGHWTRVECWCI